MTASRPPSISPEKGAGELIKETMRIGDQTDLPKATRSIVPEEPEAKKGLLVQAAEAVTGVIEVAMKAGLKAKSDLTEEAGEKAESENQSKFRPQGPK